MSLPDQAVDSHAATVSKGFKDSTPLRTREEVHACPSHYFRVEEDDVHLHSCSQDRLDSRSESSCHTHSLEYVSNSSPAESETYSNLRRATIRALSGEQLPRGQMSGPLFIGDPVAGFTIAYIFRLADLHARGRQRYYALLALAGPETKRAFEACTLIWSNFEQIAMNIVEAAEDVAARSSTDDSPPKISQITPISSFLTGRAVDQDGYLRRGTANVRANGIAELIDNEMFFCELHMMFVGILQDLGRLLGGMRVENASAESQDVDALEHSLKPFHDHLEKKDEDEKRYPVVPMKTETQLSDESQQGLSIYSIPLGGPGIRTHRQQMVV